MRSMKKFFLHVPVVLSLLVLGAHFMRYNSTIGMAISLALIGVLVLRKAWVARLVQVGLLVGAVEWALTLYRLAQMRAAMGESATRMVVILGCVIVVTAGSALLFKTRTMKRVYGLEGSAGSDS